MNKNQGFKNFLYHNVKTTQPESLSVNPQSSQNCAIRMMMSSRDFLLDPNRLLYAYFRINQWASAVACAAIYVASPPLLSNCHICDVGVHRPHHPPRFPLAEGFRSLSSSNVICCFEGRYFPLHLMHLFSQFDNIITRTYLNCACIRGSLVFTMRRIGDQKGVGLFACKCLRDSSREIMSGRTTDKGKSC